MASSPQWAQWNYYVTPGSSQSPSHPLPHVQMPTGARSATPRSQLHQKPFQYSDPSAVPDLIGKYLVDRGIQVTPENRNAVWQAVVKVLDDNAGLGNDDRDDESDDSEEYDPNQIPTIPGLLGDPTVGRPSKSPYIAPQGPLPSDRNGKRTRGITIDQVDAELGPPQSYAHLFSQTPSGMHQAGSRHQPKQQGVPGRAPVSGIPGHFAPGAGMYQGRQAAPGPYGSSWGPTPYYHQ